MRVQVGRPAACLAQPSFAAVGSSPVELQCSARQHLSAPHQSFAIASTHRQLLHTRKHALAVACIALAAAGCRHRRSTPPQPAAGASGNIFNGRHPCSRCRQHLPHTAALHQGCRSLPLLQRRRQSLAAGLRDWLLPLPSTAHAAASIATHILPAAPKDSSSCFNQGSHKRAMHHKHLPRPTIRDASSAHPQLVHMALRHTRSTAHPAC